MLPGWTLALRFAAAAAMALSSSSPAAAAPPTRPYPARATGFRWATLFDDGMVLQQSPARAAVWGFGATAGGTVSVALDGVQGGTAPVNADGGWRVELPAVAGSLNLTHTITATATTAAGSAAAHLGSGQTAVSAQMMKLTGQTLTLRAVLFGEVWVCSGQSNMVREVDWANASAAEMARARMYPQIRLFMVDRVDGSRVPLDDFLGIATSWAKPNNQTHTIGRSQPGPLLPPAVGSFAASCWFFGRDLYDGWADDAKVPLGLVLSSWGGTRDEWWSSPAALARCNHTGTATAAASSAPPHCKTGSCYDSGLWNAMVHPMLGMSFRGAVWYQGEANSKNPTGYNCSFPAMIDDWRAQFSAGGRMPPTFPFGFVQLNIVGRPTTVAQLPAVTDPLASGGFAALRWAQSAEHGYAPNPTQVNTWMAVVLDTPCVVGENGEDPVHGCGNFGSYSVHSIYKQPTGARLAYGALATAYGVGPGPSTGGLQGPVPRESVLDSAGQITVTFRGFATGFEVRRSNATGFEVFDGTQWRGAAIASAGVTAVGGGAPAATVVLAGTWGQSCTAIRYLWRSTPCPLLMCPIYSSGTDYGLPAAPFWRLLKHARTESGRH